MTDAEAALWSFLPVGYLFSVLVETPVLLVGLSARHPLRRRLFAGFWLTACTYPIVVLVLPGLLEQPFGRGVYLAVAETFAPLAECALFVAAFGTGDLGKTGGRAALARDLAVIALANLASFLGGALVDGIVGRGGLVTALGLAS